MFAGVVIPGDGAALIETEQWRSRFRNLNFAKLVAGLGPDHLPRRGDSDVPGARTKPGFTSNFHEGKPNKKSDEYLGRIMGARSESGRLCFPSAAGHPGAHAPDTEETGEQDP